MSSDIPSTVEEIKKFVKQGRTDEDKNIADLIGEEKEGLLEVKRKSALLPEFYKRIEEAVVKLHKVDSDQAFTILRELAKDDFWRYRKGAVLTFLKMDNDYRMLKILSELAEDNNEDVLHTTVFVLGKMGGAKALEILHNIIESKPPSYIRGEVASVLSGFEEKEARKLLKRLKEDESLYVRRRAEASLDEIEGQG